MLDAVIVWMLLTDARRTGAQTFVSAQIFPTMRLYRDIFCVISGANATSKLERLGSASKAFVMGWRRYPCNMHPVRNVAIVAGKFKPKSNSLSKTRRHWNI